ncbi:aspartate/glutamate racemase family protein [Kocuria salsicia]
MSTLGRTVPLIEDRLRLAGLMARCASVRASNTSVLDLERDENAAVEQDRAEVAVLGCGGMAALEGAVHQRCGVPVVDGVAAAVSVAQSLVRLRLRTSKVRTYTSPLPKDLKGFRFGR